MKEKENLDILPQNPHTNTRTHKPTHKMRYNFKQLDEGIFSNIGS